MRNSVLISRARSKYIKQVDEKMGAPKEFTIIPEWASISLKKTGNGLRRIKLLKLNTTVLKIRRRTKEIKRVFDKT